MDVVNDFLAGAWKQRKWSLSKNTFITGSDQELIPGF